MKVRGGLGGGEFWFVGWGLFVWLVLFCFPNEVSTIKES